VWLRLLFKVFFHAEIYQNDVFLFFKNYFWNQRIKTIQNIPKNLIFSKKKWILGECGLHRVPKCSLLFSPIS
jgi:hypothetical protein